MLGFVILCSCRLSCHPPPNQIAVPLYPFFILVGIPIHDIFASGYPDKPQALALLLHNPVLNQMLRVLVFVLADDCFDSAQANFRALGYLLYSIWLLVQLLP